MLIFSYLQFNYIIGINFIIKLYYERCGSCLNEDHGHIILSSLIKYLHKRNPIPQHKLICNFYQKSDILAYFPLVLLWRGGNIQFICQKFSAGSFLVHFNCTYLFYLTAGSLIIKNYWVFAWLAAFVWQIGIFGCPWSKTRYKCHAWRFFLSIEIISLQNLCSFFQLSQKYHKH